MQATLFIKVVDKTWALGKYHYLLLKTINIFYSCERYVYVKGCLRRKQKGWLQMKVRLELKEVFNAKVLQTIQTVKTKW